MAVNGLQGIKKVQMRGRNASISNSPQTVWAPGSTYAKLTTGTALEVVSSSASDTAAGTGARTVVVEGLDATFAPTKETVTLNGVTAVQMVNTSLVAVNKFYLASVGSGGVNAGNVDVRVTAAGAVKSRISSSVGLGNGRAADFIYTIPAGYIGVMGNIYFSSITTTGSLSVFLNTIDVNGVTQCVGEGQVSLTNTGFCPGQGQIFFDEGLVFPAKTMLELRAVVSAGAGDLTAQADLYLLNNYATVTWGTGA